MSVKRGQSHETGQIRRIAGGGGGGWTWRPIAAGLPAVAGPVAAAWHGEAAVCRPAWADVAAWRRHGMAWHGWTWRHGMAGPGRTWPAADHGQSLPGSIAKRNKGKSCF